MLSAVRHAIGVLIHNLRVMGWRWTWMTIQDEWRLWRYRD